MAEARKLTSAFAKRRVGLARKAAELGALTGCSVLLVVQQRATMQIYATPDWRHIVLDITTPPPAARHCLLDDAIPFLVVVDHAASSTGLSTARQRQTCFAKRREALMRKTDALQALGGRAVLALQFRDELYLYATPEWRYPSDSLFRVHRRQGGGDYATPPHARSAELKYIDDSGGGDVMLCCDIEPTTATTTTVTIAPPPLPVPPSLVFAPPPSTSTLAPHSPDAAPTLQDLRAMEEEAHDRYRKETWRALQASLERLDAAPRQLDNWQLL